MLVLMLFSLKTTSFLIFSSQSTDQDSHTLAITMEFLILVMYLSTPFQGLITHTYKNLQG